MAVNHVERKISGLVNPTLSSQVVGLHTFGEMFAAQKGYNDEPLKFQS